MKLFGVYETNDEMLDNNQEAILYKKIKNVIKNFDLVIVSDFGHGLITKKFLN